MDFRRKKCYTYLYNNLARRKAGIGENRISEVAQVNGMFKKGDYIVYNSESVCVVDDIQHLSYDKVGRDYYILLPVYEKNSTIKIPVDADVKMRKIISKKKARDVVKTIPDIQTIWVDDKNERMVLYKTALRSGECAEWLKLTKTLFEKKRERWDLGKQLSAADEHILSSAESLLHGELALALGIELEEMGSYIEKQLDIGPAESISNA